MSRPKRWTKAIATMQAALQDLQGVQEEYQNWRDGLPENLETSAVAEKLDVVTEIDLTEIEAILEEAEGTDLPLGFGRD